MRSVPSDRPWSSGPFTRSPRTTTTTTSSTPRRPLPGRRTRNGTFLHESFWRAARGPCRSSRRPSPRSPLGLRRRRRRRRRRRGSVYDNQNLSYISQSIHTDMRSTRASLLSEAFANTRGVAPVAMPSRSLRYRGGGGAVRPRWRRRGGQSARASTPWRPLRGTPQSFRVPRAPDPAPPTFSALLRILLP